MFRITMSLIGVLAFSGFLNGEIVLTIEGNDSDTVVNWSLSGSVTVNQSIIAENNNDLLYPTLSPLAWDHLAEVGTAGITSTSTINSPSITGAPTISINGGTNLFDGVGLVYARFTDNAAGDTFQFLFDGFAVHPALTNGDTVTYGGFGTMNLGAAKSTIFQDGLYVGEQLIHGSDTVNLHIKSVPEPTSFMLSMLGIGIVLGIRKRRRSANLQ